MLPSLGRLLVGIRGQYKNKRDGNEADIFAELRAHGLTVESMDTPCDALVGYRGRSYLVEVKMPAGKLTAAQERFLSQWDGCFEILRNVGDARDFAHKLQAK